MRGLPSLLAALALGACTATGGAPAAPAPAWPDPLPPAQPGVPAMHKGLAIGTWAPDAPGDFDQAWIDEAGLHSVAGGEPAARRVWRGFGATGAVPLEALLGAREGEAVAYVFALVQRAGLELPPPVDTAAVLHLRHRGRLRAWFEGRLAVDAPPPADGGWAEARVPVLLSGPFDVLLLKCGRGSPAFGAALDVEVRLSAADGTPLPDVTWNTIRPPGLPVEP